MRSRSKQRRDPIGSKYWVLSGRAAVKDNQMVVALENRLEQSCRADNGKIPGGTWALIVGDERSVREILLGKI